MVVQEGDEDKKEKKHKRHKSDKDKVRDVVSIQNPFQATAVLGAVTSVHSQRKAVVLRRLCICHADGCCYPHSGCGYWHVSSQ